MAYIDFKNLKSQVSISQAAEMLNLKLKPNKNQLRGACPACNAGDDRSLVITPERGLYYCFQAKEGGDCLGLVQHITGVELKEAADFLLPQERTGPTTVPPKPKERAAPPKKEAPFDPDAFAQKLAYGDEVEALGLDEDRAKELGVGLYRGRIYVAVRYPSGSIACFQYVDADGKIVFPKTLVPDAHRNVVPIFQKRA